MKLTGKTIFILGIAKFDGQFESTSYTTAKYFARENDVYYVDYPYTWKDYFSQNGASLNKRKPYFSNNSDGLLESGIPRLKILIVPPVLSINFIPEGFFYRFLNKINERIIAKRILKVINTLLHKEIIFINSFNFHYPNVGPLLRPKLSVYHCVDPLVVDYDKKHGVISENQIVLQSDLVVCTSRQLFVNKIGINKNTYFIPNAADLSLSSKALNPGLPVSDRLINIKKPIVGYFGNIERRIDFHLLSEVIKANKDKSFVFAGPVEKEYLPVDFMDMENVHFIGRIPYSEMPEVIKGFDVAIIPFKKDQFSATIFPLKLFEYLGSGKPVVSTDFNLDLQEFTNNQIPYCSNALEFTRALNESIHEDNDQKLKSRLEIASNNTWEKRLSELDVLLNKFYIND